MAKNVDKTTFLTNQHFFHFSFYKLFSIVISQCLPKSKFLACANFIQYTKKYQKKFWTKQTSMVTFFHNILDISQSHNRIGRVSKGSNKKSFAFKVFHFCDSKLQQRFILKEEVSISKNENESLFDNLGEFLKAFDQANKVSQIPLPKPKFEIGFTKAKDELFSHCYKDIVEHLNRQIRLSFRFEKNMTCVFSIKKFEHYGDQFILTEVVNLGYREIKHLYKNRFFVAYKCDIFPSNYDV